jgi:fructose-1,6-bisphosphatase
MPSINGKLELRLAFEFRGLTFVLTHGNGYSVCIDQVGRIADEDLANEHSKGPGTMQSDEYVHGALEFLNGEDASVKEKDGY